MCFSVKPHNLTIPSLHNNKGSGASTEVSPTMPKFTYWESLTPEPLLKTRGEELNPIRSLVRSGSRTTYPLNWTYNYFNYAVCQIGWGETKRGEYSPR